MKVKFIYCLMVYNDHIHDFLPYRYYATRALAESTLKVLLSEGSTFKLHIKRLPLFC